MNPASGATAPGPLAGLVVLELAQIMAGPTCGALLADLGADVVKVERIPGGDDTRRYAEPQIHGESAAFMMMNRNKRSIAIDLKHEEGKAVLRRLLADADVLTENYRKGTMEKLGFGYDAVAAIKKTGGEIVELTADEHKAFVSAVNPIYGEARKQLGSDVLKLVDL